MSEFIRRILVIDDNAAIHADFQKILAGAAPADDDLNAMASSLFGAGGAPTKARLTYEVAVASQGQQGLAMIQEAADAGRPFHVAFVDIRMPPGWDGIETIEHIWKVDPFLQTVICSAYSDFSWEDIHARLGDSDRLLLLKKPFDTAEIAQLAAALSEKYRLAQAAQLKLAELDGLVGQRTEELQRANEQLRLEVEQRRTAEEHLRHDVLHDRLTGLPNRSMLTDRIEQCIRRRKRDSNYQFALLFIDIDDFKVVNDSLGHEAGDKLLVGIGKRLSSAVRSLDVAGRLCDDVTSRLGGDEFVLLLDGLSRSEDAILIAQRIEVVMAAPFDIDGRDVVAGLSIGVALGRSDYDRAADVLRDADTAVYRAKNQGKHRVAVFDAEMHSQVKERLELETDLRKAMGTDQFSLAYQPVICLSSGEIRGFEALVRWRHPLHGMTGPARFIPIAEATGLIVPLGLDILRQACIQIRAWRQKFAHHPAYAKLWVAVNVSGRQLRVTSFAEQIQKVAADCGVDGSALKLEITENIVMEHGDVGFETLQRLRAADFELALDDFGTGYSSLSHLHRMPVNAIKIDQSFIRKLDLQGRPYSATVQAIVNLAHDCGMTVIGEGVETLDQLVQLQAVDCDQAQGFWFARPVAPEDAEHLLVENIGTALWRVRVQKLCKSMAPPDVASASVT